MDNLNATRLLTFTGRNRQQPQRANFVRDHGLAPLLAPGTKVVGKRSNAHKDVELKASLSVDVAEKKKDDRLTKERLGRKRCGNERTRSQWQNQGEARRVKPKTVPKPKPKTVRGPDR